MKNGQAYDSTGLSIRIHKQIDYAGENVPDKTETNAIFAVNTYTNFSTLSSNSNYPTTQGWDIELVDGSGKVWSSYVGTADQTNSFLKVDSQEQDRVNGEIFLVLKGSILCNLYDGNGNVKILTGSFNQLFSNYAN
jgi:hypothetical protein